MAWHAISVIVVDKESVLEVLKGGGLRALLSLKPVYFTWQDFGLHQRQYGQIDEDLVALLSRIGGFMTYPDVSRVFCKATHQFNHQSPRLPTYLAEIWGDLVRKGNCFMAVRQHLKATGHLRLCSNLEVPIFSSINDASLM